MAVTHGHGNPNWTRDETILALNLLFQLGDANPSPFDERVIKLSETLNQLPIHPYELRKEHFRNPAGVAFKIQNLKSVSTGKGLTNVSNMDKIIWEEFGNKPEEIQRIANEIMTDCSILNETDSLIDTVPDDETFAEGKIITDLKKKCLFFLKKMDKNIIFVP